MIHGLQYEKHFTRFHGFGESCKFIFRRIMMAMIKFMLNNIFLWFSIKHITNYKVWIVQIILFKETERLNIVYVRWMRILFFLSEFNQIQIFRKFCFDQFEIFAEIFGNNNNNQITKFANWILFGALPQFNNKLIQFGGQ